MNDKTLRRFMCKVHVDTVTGCWLWTAAKFKKSGYGQFSMCGRAGQPRGAHCVSYEHFVGPVPDGLVLDHLCRTRACCNWAHLEPVTHKENIRRGGGARAVAHRAGTCTRGHLMSGENLYKDPAGRGYCRTCVSARGKQRYAANKARLINCTEIVSEH